MRGENAHAIRIVDLSRPTRKEVTENKQIGYIQTDITDVDAVSKAFDAPWPQGVEISAADSVSMCRADQSFGPTQRFPSHVCQGQCTWDRQCHQGRSRSRGVLLHLDILGFRRSQESQLLRLAMAKSGRDQDMAVQPQRRAALRATRRFHRSLRLLLCLVQSPSGTARSASATTHPRRSSLAQSGPAMPSTATGWKTHPA